MERIGGGENYWRRFAREKRWPKPTKVEKTKSGYAITFGDRAPLDTPFVGSDYKRDRLIADIQHWIDEDRL